MIAADTIFVTLAGSHAHGTARAGSDLDLRGVCIVTMSTRLSLFEHFEQYEGPLDAGVAARIGERLPKLEAAKIECVIYDVAKLLALCAAANPNTLELIFADERDWLLDTPAWHRVHDARRMFLTRRVQATYLGYALAQLQKIQTHRGWLLHPPSHHPTRAEFGLPEHSTLSADDREHLREAASTAGLSAGVIAALESERRYRAAMKHWESYERWKSGRNPARAELERRFGYDTKHAMHLVRLMRMGLEVLRTGDLAVRRSDADELLAIRDGALPFDRLLELANDLQSQIRDAPTHAELPHDIDRARVDALLLALVRET